MPYVERYTKSRIQRLIAFDLVCTMGEQIRRPSCGFRSGMGILVQLRKFNRLTMSFYSYDWKDGWKVTTLVLLRHSPDFKDKSHC